MTKRRVFDQMGQMKADFEFKDGRAAGTMTMGRQSKPINSETDGALFADGTGSYSVIATLPLAEGYATTYRNYDAEKSKIKTMLLKVADMERVKVPAGEFDA